MRQQPVKEDESKPIAGVVRLVADDEQDRGLDDLLEKPSPFCGRDDVLARCQLVPTVLARPEADVVPRCHLDAQMLKASVHTGCGRTANVPYRTPGAVHRIVYRVNSLMRGTHREPAGEGQHVVIFCPLP